VMHDSREDSSAFLSQFGIELAGVFDSQVAHTMMLEQQALRPFQISLNELLKMVLRLENEKEASLGQRMKKDPNVWPEPSSFKVFLFSTAELDAS
ncbi:Hypothetical protein (Fragment), partial [Durusdinium trenchii]